MAPDAAARSDIDVTYPKIELHVHLEGTVRPATLLEIAHRNDYALPVSTEAELTALYEFRDFDHFIEIWVLTTNALRAGRGLSPGRRRLRDARRPRTAPCTSRESSRPPNAHAAGSTGTRSSAGTATAPRRRASCHGVEIRLTPDIIRGFTLEEARRSSASPPSTATAASSASVSAESRREYSARALRARLHAARAPGTRVGAARRRGGRARRPSAARSKRSAPTDAPRHPRRRGSRARARARRPRGSCSTSARSRTCARSAVASLDEHPLPQLVAAGVRVLDLDRRSGHVRHRSDAGLRRRRARSGSTRDAFYEAGVAGALCDDDPARAAAG